MRVMRSIWMLGGIAEAAQVIMFAYLPTGVLAGTSSSDFVYLYSHFGNTHSSNDGFEEWSLVVNPVPEASMFLPVIRI